MQTRPGFPCWARTEDAAWLIVLVNLYVFTNHIMSLPTFPFFIQSLGGSEAIAGICAAAFSLVSVINRPFVSWWLDNGARKAALVIGLLLLGAAPPGYVLVPISCHATQRTQNGYQAEDAGPVERGIMSKLDDFMQLLCGEFDNREQFEAKRAAGETFPLAHHVNTACNDKILGLPDDFAGTFMVEESYYEVDGKKSASPHLFLFTEEKDGVLLTSYDTPEGNDKRTFSYATMVPAEFSSLRESGKFTPALYREHDGVWEGGSDSMFSPVMRFHLFERFSADVLEVSESMEMNGKRVFGFDEPILYKRIGK